MTIDDQIRDEKLQYDINREAAKISALLSGKIDKYKYPINFIGFKAPLHLYRDIYDGNIELEKAEKDQGQFKLDLDEVARGNSKKKSADQIKAIANIKNLYKSREKVVDLFHDFAMIRCKAKYETKHGTGLKISTPKQMLQRLSIAVAQIKAGNNTESLLNEIGQIIYSLYQSKEIAKKVYNNIIKSIHL